MTLDYELSNQFFLWLDSEDGLRGNKRVLSRNGNVLKLQSKVPNTSAR